MKVVNFKINSFQGILLFMLAMLLIIFSKSAREGAYDGLKLAMNTVLPSLLPLLIIFLTVMKTGAKSLFSKLFGFVSRWVFNLPEPAISSFLFGMLGGYPTGALLSEEMFESNDLSREQAKRMMCFNFCGGCGFIITAVGSVVFNDAKIGNLLYFSNVISAVLLGFMLSFKEKRIKKGTYSFDEYVPLGDALCVSTNKACKSVLLIASYIILFSAVCNIFKIPDIFLPILEITNGVCNADFSLPMTSAFLSFGGICIHLQLSSVMRKLGLKYMEFLVFRALGGIISYFVMKLLLLLFPTSIDVFAPVNAPIKFSSVNVTLSVLLIIGCFVSVLDLDGKKKKV